MTTIKTIDWRLRRRGVRGVAANDGGGGVFIGGIIWVGLASAGDGARRILGRLSGFRRAAGSWSVGGSWRPADGRRWVAGSGGGGVVLPRQSGSPGRCGGVTCAIVPYLVAAGGKASKNPPRARSQSDSHVHQEPIALATRHRHGACRRIFRVDRGRRARRPGVIADHRRGSVLLACKVTPGTVLAKSDRLLVKTRSAR
jgi:hypothetical protein